MKRNVIILYENLSPKIKKALETHYPYGFEDKTIKYQNLSTGKSYDGLVFNFEDTTYLIKFQLEGEIGFNTEDDNLNEINNLNTEL